MIAPLKSIKAYLINHGVMLGCLFSLNASAGTMGAVENEQHDIFNGMYAGVMAGVAQFNQSTTLSRAATYPLLYSSNSMLSVSQTNKTYTNNAIGALYLGYGHFVQDSLFYLAGELFADFSNHKKSINSTAYDQNNSTSGGSVFQNTASLNTNAKMKLSHAEVAVDLKPGYLFDEATLIYGRIGVAFNKVRLNTYDVFTFTNIPSPADNASSTSSNGTSRHQSSLRLGIGLERRLTSDFSLTADYIYTGYGRTTITHRAPTVGQDSNGDPAVYPTGLEKYTSSSLSTSTVMIGIKRYFSDF